MCIDITMSLRNPGILHRYQCLFCIKRIMTGLCNIPNSCIMQMERGIWYVPVEPLSRPPSVMFTAKPALNCASVKPLLSKPGKIVSGNRQILSPADRIMIISWASSVFAGSNQDVLILHRSFADGLQTFFGKAYCNIYVVRYFCSYTGVPMILILSISFLVAKAFGFCIVIQLNLETLDK